MCGSVFSWCQSSTGIVKSDRSFEGTLSARSVSEEGPHIAGHPGVYASEDVHPHTRGGVNYLDALVSKQERATRVCLRNRGRRRWPQVTVGQARCNSKEMNMH